MQPECAMKTACALVLSGFFLSLAAAQDAKEPASKGQKGELVPSPFRAYIVEDGRLPSGINDDTNAHALFLDTLKLPERSERIRFVEQKAGADLKLKRNIEEWLSAYYAINRKDMMHDLVCEHGLNPVVAIFVRDDAKKLAPTAGVGKLAAEVNKLLQLPDYRGAKTAAFVIYLKVKGPPKSVTLVGKDKSQTMVELDSEYPDDEDRDLYAGEIREGAKQVNAPNVVFGLAPIKSKAAAAWDIADDDAVTVVLFNQIRVVNRWKYKADAGPNDDEVKQIIAAVQQSVLGEKK
jgi:hypothetical protein